MLLGPRRRRPWAGARRSRDQAHAGSVDSAGDPGRGQHAGVRQEPQSRGGHGARHVPRDAASGAHRAGARQSRTGGPGGDTAFQRAVSIAQPVDASSVALAVLASWRIDVLPTTILVLTGIIYFRGWRRLWHLHDTLLPRWRLVCFTAGLTSLWLAAASPLDTLSSLLLTAHMTQHLVLMAVAPPLILLGAPIVPLLRGLPRCARSRRARPVPRLACAATLRAPPDAPRRRTLGDGRRDVGLARAGPLPARAAGAVLARRGTRDVLREPPALLVVGRQAVAVHPALARVVDPANAAPRRPSEHGHRRHLTFSGRVLYPVYEQVPRLGGLSALDDQVMAGVVMWVPGSLVFLIPAIVVTVRLLSPVRPRRPKTTLTPRPAQSRRGSIFWRHRSSARSCAHDTAGTSCRERCWCWPSPSSPTGSSATRWRQ